MDNFDRDLEDLLNMTDTDEDTSSSSNQGVFESRKPFVLVLHELDKDEPSAEAAAKSREAKKTKKEKRKKKKAQHDANKDHSSETSSSLSDSIPTLPDDAAKEEFYDAHESYHALPENQPASPTAALILGQVQSENVPTTDPKLVPQEATSENPSVAAREPSIINKPVTNPP